LPLHARSRPLYVEAHHRRGGNSPSGCPRSRPANPAVSVRAVALTNHQPRVHVLPGAARGTNRRADGLFNCKMPFGVLPLVGHPRATPVAYISASLPRWWFGGRDLDLRNSLCGRRRCCRRRDRRTGQDVWAESGALSGELVVAATGTFGVRTDLFVPRFQPPCSFKASQDRVHSAALQPGCST
jgi:hypothetical protein